MKKSTKRWLSLMLTLVMLLGMVPAFELPARAEDTQMESFVLDNYKHWDDLWEEYFADAITGSNVSVSPTVDDMYVWDGCWYATPGANVKINALNGYAITKLVITLGSTYSQTYIIANGRNVSGTKSNNVLTFDNVNATEALLITETNDYAQIDVYYDVYVPATGVTVSPDTTTLTVGDMTTLTAAVEPEDATDTCVTWVSSDEAVATVADGIVTAVGAGTATITATTTDGGFTDSCNVTVNAPVIDTWEKLRKALYAGGNIVLDADVTAGNSDTALTVPENATAILDLNGHTINANNMFGVIWVDGDLTLNDSSEARTGKLTGGDDFYGGVFVFKGTFTMNGGSITDNTSSAAGGGVYVEEGIFEMNGGSIADNNADSDGGGVYVYDGTFTMTGGSITNNTTSGVGGGVYVKAGTFEMNGGSIADNNADSGGGGVFVADNCQFTMTDGSITGNTTNGNGGGLCSGFINTTFTITGGSITDNTAQFGGGGVHSNNATFNISDNVNISGNHVSVQNPDTGETTTVSNNVQLYQRVINVIGSLDQSSLIGVSMITPGVFTSGLSDKGTAANFTSDDADYSIKVNGDGEAELAQSVPVTGVTLNQTSVTIAMDETVQLTANVEPSDATDTSVTWTSSDENVATVDENGVVEPKAEGTATITATTTDGGYDAACTVTVVQECYKIWVGDTQVTSANADNITGEETATASYNATTNTLTLNGFIFEGIGHQLFNWNAGICYEENGSNHLTIELIGTNTITNTNLSSGNNRSTGIYIDADEEGQVVITGDGSLNMTAIDVDRSFGIFANTLIVIKDTDITASGDSEGINGSVEINNSNVTARGNDYGIAGETVKIINGSTVTAIGEEDTGISATIDIIIDGSTVVGEGEEFGIIAPSVTISNSTVTGTGDAYGILCYNTPLTINEGSTVNATGGERAFYGSVINNISGIGWTDTEGTAGQEDIAINTESRELSYRKVMFPAMKTVSFVDEDGTTVLADALKVKYGETATKPADPTKAGYTFKHWKLEGAEFDFDTLITGDITLTAVWEETASIDWEHVTIEFNDGSDGLYTYTGEDITPDIIVKDGENKLKIGDDYTVEGGTSSAAGLHTITVSPPVGVEGDAKTIDWYIYNLTVTSADVEGSDTKLKFTAKRNTDKQNVSEFGMVFDRKGLCENDEELSLDKKTNVSKTNTKTTTTYNVTVVDAGSGVKARPYMKVTVNGKEHTVYGGVTNDTRSLTISQIPEIVATAPAVNNGKLNTGVEIKPYTSDYELIELGVLFSKDGTFADETAADAGLTMENAAKGDIGKACLNQNRLTDGQTMSDYSVYRCNISFVDDYPIYTKAYAIVKKGDTEQTIFLTATVHNKNN